MAEPEKNPPFYEHRAFQGAVAVIGLLTAVWALIGAPRPWSVATEITAVEAPPLSNTEVVLVADRSMGESFDGATKMDAAVEAIDVIGQATSNQGLALRRGGESCGDPGEQIVGFGSHHGDDIATAAEDVVPAGQADLSSAVNGALDDLEDPSLKPSSRKGVIVFLGGKDKCDEEAVSDVRREIEAHGVSPQFKIIALVDDQREKRWVGHLEAGLRPWDVDVVEATTREAVKESAARAVEETASPPGSQTITGGEEEDRADEGEAETSTVPVDPEEEPSPDEVEEKKEGEAEGEGESEEGEPSEGGGGEEEASEGSVAPSEASPSSPSGEASTSEVRMGGNRRTRPLYALGIHHASRRPDRLNGPGLFGRMLADVVEDD